MDNPWLNNPRIRDSLPVLYAERTTLYNPTSDQSVLKSIRAPEKHNVLQDSGAITVYPVSSGPITCTRRGAIKKTKQKTPARRLTITTSLSYNWVRLRAYNVGIDTQETGNSALTM